MCFFAGNVGLVEVRGNVQGPKMSRSGLRKFLYIFWNSSGVLNDFFKNHRMLQLHSGFGVFLRPCAKAKCKTKNASNLAPNFMRVCGNCRSKMQLRTIRPFG